MFRLLKQKQDQPVNRLFRANIVIICVVLCAMPGRDSFAGYETSCGLGLPPDAPGYAAARAREEAEAQRTGSLGVCESDLERFSISFDSIDVATRTLDFQPVNLTHTPFAQFESLGGKAEVVSKKKSRLYRGFRMPSGHTLTLFEHDMSADGSSIWRDPKDEPEKVNGLPARLSVLQTKSGKAVSHLSWTEGRRSYELWVDANVTHQPLREKLFKLAASVPISIPACPNDPSSRAMRMGSDGRAVSEPPPAVLTEQQLKALVARQRPCK